MRHTPCGCRSAHLVEVRSNLRLPRHYSMRRAPAMPLFRTQSAAEQTSLAPHDSKARLRVATTRRDSWRSHVHRTRLHSVCSSSSLKLPMQTPFFWTGDARFLSRERKWGSHHAACMPQSTSHLCEKEEPSLERDSSFLFYSLRKRSAMTAAASAVDSAPVSR